jgi:hypothetical protein
VADSAISESTVMTCILLGEYMPSATVIVPPPTVKIFTSIVFGLCHRFKVIGIAAQTFHAQVVDM